MTDDASDQTMDIALKMAVILGTMLLVLLGLVFIQSPAPSGGALVLASQQHEPSKRAYESWVALYTPIWILAFGVIVAFRMYETFSAASYMVVCVGLALPFLLQPALYPSAGFDSPDQHRPLLRRYSFKANLWLAVYSFIGNYYYTHYFYNVLKAKYTMPAHRLNNVPIALFFATHFYFSTYHLFSNIMLRLVETAFAPSARRTLLFWAVVTVFAYFTAYMETLTISSYPDYSFEDRHAAYTLGSAFYGIYFLVSFPAFYYFDRNVDDTPMPPAVVNGVARKNGDSNGSSNSRPAMAEQQRIRGEGGVTVWDTIVSSCGYGMIILTLLDFVRLSLGIAFVMDVNDGAGSTCKATQL